MSVQMNTDHGNAGEAAGLADASIKGRWEFGNRRGAFLIISRPHSSYIPPKVVFKQLVDIPELKNKPRLQPVLVHCKWVFPEAAFSSMHSVRCD